MQEHIKILVAILISFAGAFMVYSTFQIRKTSLKSYSHLVFLQLIVLFTISLIYIFSKYISENLDLSRPNSELISKPNIFFSNILLICFYLFWYFYPNCHHIISGKETFISEKYIFIYFPRPFIALNISICYK